MCIQLRENLPQLQNQVTSTKLNFIREPKECIEFWVECPERTCFPYRHERKKKRQIRQLETPAKAKKTYFSQTHPHKIYKYTS